MKYLLDTHSWIEMFIGSSSGRTVKKLVEGKNKICVSDSTFAEIYSWAVRNDEDPGFLLMLVRQHAEVIEIDTNLWVEGAAWKERMRVRHKNFGLIDGLLLAIQQRIGGTIVTGDPHFKGLKKIMML
ncbi:type II toxin-antitoxin system VapC family toxin [Candidatus Woesearchaeota archaeon]|nr:type II toxin-antitoxin system VapC family toxin [Candidatus Woesearchaeota archaeon]